MFELLDRAAALLNPRVRTGAQLRRLKSFFQFARGLAVPAGVVLEWSGARGVRNPRTGHRRLALREPGQHIHARHAILRSVASARAPFTFRNPSPIWRSRIVFTGSRITWRMSTG